MVTAEQFMAAVSGATGGAAIAAITGAGVLRRALDTEQIADKLVNASLSELIRTAREMYDLDTETRTAVRLVASSPGSLKSAAVTAATSLRAKWQAATASAGRIESAYQQSNSENLVEAASMANAMRQGLIIAYAAKEAARQLDVIAGKIKI